MRGVLAALVIILLIPAMSFAGGGKTYVEVKGGQYKPKSDLAERNAHNGSNFELSVGHRFFNHFALEVSYGHYKTEGDLETLIFVDPILGELTFTGHATVEVYPLLLTGKFLFPVDDGYLFVGGGYGRYLVSDLEEIRVDGEFFHAKDDFRAYDTVNGWHYMLGTMYDINKRWTLGFEYKVVNTEQAELTDKLFGVEESFKTDVDGRMISAFVAWRF